MTRAPHRRPLGWLGLIFLVVGSACAQPAGPSAAFSNLSVGGAIAVDPPAPTAAPAAPATPTPAPLRPTALLGPPAPPTGPDRAVAGAPSPIGPGAPVVFQAASPVAPVVDLAAAQPSVAVAAPAVSLGAATIEAIPTSRPVPTVPPAFPVFPTPQPVQSVAVDVNPPPAPPPATAPYPAAFAGPVRQSNNNQVQLPGRTGPIPRSIQIPDIRVNVPIIPVGLEPSGILASPNGPDLVGWYAGGPRAGQAGNLLLDGHRDWHEGPRPAVFWSLDQLVPNRSQLVVWSDTQGFVYLVTENFGLHRDDPNGLRVISPTADPTITLITCEGTFESATREYDNRRVVKARLIGTLAR